MRIKLPATAVALLFAAGLSAQRPAAGSYVATFLRTDSLPIRFNLESSVEKGKEVWVVRNASERIRVTELESRGDSLFVRMPLFESGFRLQRRPDGPLSGVWVKATSRSQAVQPVVIRPGTVRYPVDRGPARYDLSGRWQVTFQPPDGRPMQAVAEFTQRGEKLTGTFLTPTGDYRYLEGVVTGDSLRLSCFDGSHAFYFGAHIAGKGRIDRGVFASGLTYRESWTAVKDPAARMDEGLAAMSLRPGEETLGFSFPDLDGNRVSLSDERFRDRVVVIQIMGSWCPNCMDETAFLSSYYDRNRDRGVEMVALAYEYATDIEAAKKTLSRMRDRYAVRYPMLITGVSSADTLRTEKTLPELTPIKAFPTTIFIGRDGRVKKVHGGFSGPATGVHYEEFKKSFEETVTELLKAGAASPR